MRDLRLDCWRVGVTPVPARPTTFRPDLWRAVASRDWLVAGMALQRTLLTATMQGLLAGLLNQAMAFPPLRLSLGDRVGAGTVPQLLLRVGYGQLPPPTPRRTIDEIMAE